MIPALVVSLLAVVGFAVVLWLTRIGSVARRCLSTTVSGVGAMLDANLDDHAKEIAVREAGLRLIASAFGIFWRFSGALGAAALPILCADFVGLAPTEAVLSLMLRWDYLVGVTLLAILVSTLARRRRGSARDDDTSAGRYTPADRFFHQLAFAHPSVLKSASRAEDVFFSKALRVPDTSPIFIASLARGGTTALLNALSDLPEIATHRYRDMPFVTAPLLWNRLAGGKRRVVERRARAHGDGLEIDLDTPEAFEEVLWKLYWPEMYGEHAIALWGGDLGKQAAEDFLRAHFRKVIAARASECETPPPKPLRYCSKNNGNIARVPYLLNRFSGGRIVIPVRRPESHAASLLRQHENFLRQQSEDAFIKRYMGDIGHFEFGLLHKAIEFPDFDPGRYASRSADYWLAYWISAFRWILPHGQRCTFVFQDDLRARPQQTMESLCGALGLEHGELDFSSYFLSGADVGATDPYDPHLLDEAADLYRQLEIQAQRADVPAERDFLRGANG